MKLEEILVEIGLTENAASVYEILLDHENMKATDIARLTGISRSVVYQVVDDLEKRQLIKINKQEGQITTFSVLPPEYLLNAIDNIAKKYTRLSGQIHMLQPEIDARYKGNNPKSKVRYYEGAEGLIRAYEETLTSTERILAYASIENMHSALPGYFPEYYRRRAGAGIPIKSVHPDTPEARERVENDKQESRESALVPADKYAFSPEINVFDNKIIFFSLVEKFSLIIESRELADAFKKIFDLSWAQAEKHSKKIKKEILEEKNKNK